MPTTIAATATPAVTATPLGINARIPTFAGLKEFEVSPEIAGAATRQIPNLTNASVKYYFSDEAPDKVATSVNADLTGAGYKFAIPGQNKPIKTGEAYAGFYAKAGAPDISITISDPAKTGQLLKVAGVSEVTIQQYNEQLKDKKSVLVLLTANNLLQSVGLGG